ncbi:MAG TPA: DUF4282 domain-containing protein [Euzebyales bacterium]|nr:DUF4282 domain-containing protein [Euzebyales bacterium]
MSTASRPPGFLSTLFDATFSHLLALRLVRVLYLIALMSIGTVAFVMVFSGIGQGGATALLAVVVIPALALFAIAVVRVVLEVVVVILRLGEQTERMATTLYTLSTHLRSEHRRPPDD